MARPKKETPQEPLEKQLWSAADKLRKNLDAADYKHVVLGLIFLKYISDSFESLRAQLLEGKGEFEGADPEYSFCTIRRSERPRSIRETATVTRDTG